MPVASLIAYIVILIVGLCVLAAGGIAFRDGFMTYQGINQVLFSFSILFGFAILGFSILGMIGNQRKKLNLIALSVIILLLLFIGILGMGIHVFVARQNYLPNDPDGPPLPDCHQEYESFNDLVHTYQQVGTFFCKAGCPCNYEGTFKNPDLTVNPYGSQSTQKCFEFRNLPNLTRAAALLKHVEQTYNCSGLCQQVFPIYYFSNVNAQKGPVTLLCDGKLRLFVDQSSLSIAGLMFGAALAQFLALIVIISNFCHPGFYVIFPNEILEKVTPLVPHNTETNSKIELKRTPSFQIVATESESERQSKPGLFHIQTITDKSVGSFN